MVQLDPREAILLLPGVVTALSRDAGIRTLIIKGPTLADQGLRRQRQSSDVDALVDPGQFETLTAILTGRGWADRDEKALAPLGGRTSMFTVHSLTLMHPEWPVSIDLHRCYPGFFATPQLLFDELWHQRQFATIGGQPCAIPDRIDHWLLAMLHVTRDRNHRERAELREAADAFDQADRIRVQVRAGMLGAVEPLRGELERWGITFAPPTADDLRLLHEWERVTSAEAHGDLFHLNELLRARGAARFAMVRKALFPPETAYRLFHDVRPGRWGYVRALFGRWVAGVRASPRMVRYMLSAIRARQNSGNVP